MPLPSGFKSKEEYAKYMREYRKRKGSLYFQYKIMREILRKLVCEECRKKHRERYIKWLQSQLKTS